MSFNGKSITVFAHDYETTGVKVQELGVVQSALCFAILHQDGSFEIQQSDVQLLNPGVNIEPEAAAIHGIDDFMVADKPHWEDYLREQMKVVNESDVDAVLSFNGNRFDNQIAARVGWIPTPSIDLFKAASEFKRQKLWEKANLGYSYEKLMGEPLLKAHDAFADIVATLKLVQPAMKLAGHQTLDDFHLWMLGDAGTPDMVINFGKFKGRKLKMLDTSYLKWLLSDKCEMTLNSELRQGIEATLVKGGFK